MCQFVHRHLVKFTPKMSNNDDLSDLPELEDMGDTDTSIIVDK